jgi:hypothetical protein
MERERMEDLGVDGRTILKCISKKAKGGVEWMYLAQDKNQWRAPVTIGFHNTQSPLTL